MSITSIQFIGIFVVMANSGAGLHILLPHFPGTQFESHTSAIQFSPDQVTDVSWPGIKACETNPALQCAPVNVETITFSGAIDPSPADVIGSMSHLSCCCNAMADILPKYKDPNASGKLSAHIFVKQGVAEAIRDSSGRTDTWVTMHSSSPAGITLIANAKTSSSFKIVFKPGAQFTIQNSPVMTATAATPTPRSHFLAYYLMGTGTGTSTCTSVPSGVAECAPSQASCAALKKQIAKPPKPRAVAADALLQHDVGPDCTNSHFP